MKNNQSINSFEPCVIWLTGLSGAGKTTIAAHLFDLLVQSGGDAFVLDGDLLRNGLCSDLGFSYEDRCENTRRISEVAKLFCDTGKLVIAATISPFQKMRDDARMRIGSERFVEVFINTPLALCEERDPKGLYRKARSGEIAHFTGIDAPYEIPTAADVQITTEGQEARDSAKQIQHYLLNRGFLRD